MAEETPVADTPTLQAAEYALRLLPEGDEAMLAARAARDPAFAAEVDGWNARFATLFDGIAEITPAAQLWPGIVDRLDAQEPARGDSEPDGTVSDGGVLIDLTRRLRRWRAASIVLGGIAACLALLLVLPLVRAPTPSTPAPTVVVQQRPVPTPVPVPVSNPPLAVAQLSSEDGVPLLAVGIERATGTLRLRVLDLPADARVPELWIIPEGGAPQSLGLIASDGRLDVTLSPEARRQLTRNATLAVSLEEAAGAPHASPAGPIVATGQVVLL